MAQPDKIMDGIAPNPKPTTEPRYGKRSILSIIAERAAATSDAEWVSIPRGSKPSDGWYPVSYAQALRGIDRVAHRLTDVLGVPGSRLPDFNTPEVQSKHYPPKGNPSDPHLFPTVAYIGPNDVRYIVFALGACKAGFQAMFISPRNSHDGQMNLFERTHCVAVGFDATYKNIVQPWLDDRPEMKPFMALPLEKGFFPAEGEVEPFPYEERQWDGGVEWDPLLLLHTSGSTGFPKPIVVRQGMMAVADAMQIYEREKGRPILPHEVAMKSKRIFMPSKYRPVLKSVVHHDPADSRREQCPSSMQQECTLLC